MNMIILQDSGEPRDKCQDNVTTTKHMVTYTMMNNNTVQKSITLVNECYNEYKRNY